MAGKTYTTIKYLLVLIALAVVATGCSTITIEEEKPPPMIDGQIVRQISDQMMRTLLNSNAIAQRKDVPKIALLNFRNRSRFPLDGNIFLSKLRADLNSKAVGRITFLARNNIKAVKNERNAKRKGVFSFRQGSLKQAISGADYFLTGEMRSLSGAKGGHRSDYIHITLFLVNAENTDILWEDQFDIDFKGTENIVYR